MLNMSLVKIDVVEGIDCDNSRLYGSINEAIAYLQEMQATHGSAISLEENWTGYEDMHMRFVFTRKETNEEFAARQEQIESALGQARLRDIRSKERNARRRQYEKLKKEFG